MMALTSKENWLKGVLGLGIMKDALTPFLGDHFKQTSEKWNNGDNHLRHLLDLGAKKELKQTKKEGQFWNVNCSDCRPILEELVNSHRQPKHLMWMNNEEQDLNVSDEYRLSKLFMSSGNAGSQNLRDHDPLAILEVCRNDKRLGFVDAAYVLILFRNRLMHSSDNCITEDELTGAFDEMKNFLGNDKLKDLEECNTAVTKLSELLKKPMLCEIEESNEIWKMAISIKDMALKKEGGVNPEALKKLLEDIQNQLLKETRQRRNAESTLATSQRELTNVQNELQASKDNERYEKRRVEQIRIELENRGRENQNLQADNRTLQEEIKELKNHTPTLTGRIAKGTATGTGVGFMGGPVGAVVGGAAGGVVGGVSYFWDKVTGK